MASKRTLKKSIPKIPPKTAERIVAVSLQNPELGARRLVPLLKKKRIAVSATTVQRILRREGLQSREKRLAKIKKRRRRPKVLKKKPSAQITAGLANRIVKLSLKKPELGARRLAAELEKKKIVVSASTVYTVLKRNGLQTRKMRLAKIAETSAEPVIIQRTFPAKIPPEVEDRIIALSLQNPNFGTGRLTPLLQQEEIFVSASAVYTILKRNNIENRQKRLLRLELLQGLETLPVPEAEGPEPVPEQLTIELPPAEAEPPEAVFEPAVVVSKPPAVEIAVPADLPEPVVEPVTVAPAEPQRPPVKKAPVKTIKKRGHWIFYPLYLLLFVLIGYLGLHAFQAIQTVRVETAAGTAAEPATGGIAAGTENAASVRPLDGYRQIWERNLFNITEPKEPESEEKIALDKLTLAEKELGLELVGTVVADDPKLSRAIIDDRSLRKQEAFREGDTAGEVKIKKILRNNVVITTAKGDELLTVEIKESGRRSTPYPTAQQVGSQSTAERQTAPSTRSYARTRSIKLKREKVEASLSDIDALMEQLQITPYMQGDQPSGFRLSNIPADSILRKMGLNSRDVIVGVDDENIISPDQAPDFFQRLAAGEEVIIRVKRRRRSRRIKLSFE